MALGLAVLAVALSCLVIWRASDGFEAASSYLGRNLSEGVRGATINAIGSSMPELFTTLLFLFALSEADKFAGGIGTTAGSAIFNGMIIPAVVIFSVVNVGLVSKVVVSKKVILRDGLALILCEFGLIFLISGSELLWWHGLVLMLMYATYVIVMFSTMSRSGGEEGNDEEDENEPTTAVPAWRAWLTLDLEAALIKGGIDTRGAWMLLGAATLVIGVACYILVESCIQIGNGMGIRTYFVAVVIASAATSVPDTILSYRDAMAGKYDDAVANALGSNIFDICFALGFPLFLYTLLNGPIEMSSQTLDDVTELRVLLLAMTIAAFLIYYIGRGMGRLKALLLLGIYLLFTLYILGKAYDVAVCNDIGVFLRGLAGR